LYPKKKKGKEEEENFLDFATPSTLSITVHPWHKIKTTSNWRTRVGQIHERINHFQLSNAYLLSEFRKNTQT
jgi:hypothetical protein